MATWSNVMARQAVAAAVEKLTVGGCLHWFEEKGAFEGGLGPAGGQR